MKDGKAEVLSTELRPNNEMHVAVKGREDAELFVTTMQSLSAPSTSFEIVGDTLVICRMGRK